jgi:hypothetical protein
MSSPINRIVVAFLAVASSAVAGQPIPTETKPPQRGKVVQFAPNLRIDWNQRRVEIDGTVVLREGPLELFACSINTREHESIVAVNVQPQRIFHALGLVGLTPGRPIQYDEQTQSWRPATGDRVRIHVRWKRNDRSHTTDIGQWMRTVDSDKPVPPDIWRFAGSDTAPDGTFMADVDGTIICVVDFVSAIIAVGESKSADNESLWVHAHTPKIPPIGTKVTILITVADPLPIRFRVDERGTLRHNDTRITPDNLEKTIQSLTKQHENAPIELVFSKKTPKKRRTNIENAVRSAAPKTTIIVRDHGTEVDRTLPKDNSDSP